MQFLDIFGLKRLKNWINNKFYTKTEIDNKIPNLENYATKSDVSDAIENLIGAAPEALDTLGEIADALSNGEAVESALTNQIAAKYTKPSTGIPATDLTSDVQSALNKANSAIQNETDPIFSASAASTIQSTDIENWNSKTSNTGTITGITMNGVSKGTSGVVNLGTVLTEHQDISGKANTSDIKNATLTLRANNTNYATTFSANADTDTTIDLGYMVHTVGTGSDIQSGNIKLKTINNNSILGEGNVDTSEIVYVDYGKTPYADVSAAVNAGKQVICFSNGGLLPLIADQDGTYLFSAPIIMETPATELEASRTISGIIGASIDSTNGWSDILETSLPDLTNVESTTNKVTSLSESSTDTQYPSAKAVYDMITDDEQVIGAALNNLNSRIDIQSEVVPKAATTAPLMDGTAAVGSSTKYAKEDHVHPSDTSKANVANPQFTGTASVKATAAATERLLLNPSQASLNYLTSGENEVALVFPSNVTGDIDITLPNQQGTLALTSDIPEDKVFWATRGTTTFAEVLAAYNAGKLVCVNHNGVVFVLSSYNSTDSEFLFASCNAEYSIEFLYLDNNGWDPAGTSLAGTNSPAFTGTPTAPTAATGTNTTQIATTAFVQNTINSSSNKEVLWVTYGTTSFDPIWDAYNDGKIILCKYDDYVYYCIGYSEQGESMDFVCPNGFGYGGGLNYIACIDGQGWDTGRIDLEHATNKVYTVNSSSTNLTYPSTKAVYDTIQNAVPVFWATYGTTTITEIRTAVNAGKHVLLKYVDGYYTYIYELQQDDGDLYFYCHDIGGNRKIVLEDNGETGTWNTPSVTVFAQSSDLLSKEDTSNKVTSLSSSSTDTQYPSAKCVYDMIGDIESVLDQIIQPTNS